MECRNKQKKYEEEIHKMKIILEYENRILKITRV